MRDTGVFKRLAGDPVWDSGTGTYVKTYVTVYDGIAQIKPAFSPAERSESAGQRETTFRFYEVIIPWDSVEIQIDDIWVTSTSDDARLVGKELTVGSVEYASNRTAYHVTVWDQDRDSG